MIVFPAQLGTEEDYAELTSDVTEAIGLKMYTAPLSRLDWPVSEVAVSNSIYPSTQSPTHSNTNRHFAHSVTHSGWPPALPRDERVPYRQPHVSWHPPTNRTHLINLSPACLHFLF